MKLLDRVNKTDGCWEWIGDIAKVGYGRMYFFGKRRYAHRVSYEIYKGKIPSGMLVCHHCDNPKCVNPDHLFLGTKRDNALDASSKGRLQHGENHTKALLSERDVIQIRRIYANQKKTQLEIAKLFGVSGPCVWAIVNGVNWKTTVA